MAGKTHCGKIAFETIRFQSAQKTLSIALVKKEMVASS